MLKCDQLVNNTSILFCQADNNIEQLLNGIDLLVLVVFYYFCSIYIDKHPIL